MFKWLQVPGQTGRLTSMDGLRAYAAGIVFIYHAALIIQEQQHTSGLLMDWMLHSQYGVDIFFVLSGYLIAGLVNKPDFQFRSYLIHRVARIYPALLGMLAVCVFGLVYLRGERVDPWLIVSNVLLLNGVPGLDLRPINNVTWSLFFEFAFYAVFPPLYRRFGLSGSAFVAALVLLPLSQIDVNYLRFGFFFLGAWIKLDTDGRTMRLGEAPAIWLYLLITTLTMRYSAFWMFVALYALAVVPLVSATLRSRGVLHAVFSWSPLRILGGISYSFYLLHPVGLLAARYAIEPMQLDGVRWAVALIMVGFAISFALAGASFALLERPYFLLRGPHSVPAAAQRSPVRSDQPA